VTTYKVIADVLILAASSSCVGTSRSDEQDIGQVHMSDRSSRSATRNDLDHGRHKEPILGYRNFTDPTIQVQSGL